MQINSISNQNFGKIYVDKDARDILAEHVAYGIGNENFKTFSEKYRLCNLSDTVELKVTKEGVNLHNKQTGESKNFEVKSFDASSPNLLFHLLNAALNYSFISEGQLFKN